uniref:Uncharacterized protein n=1 Tax=Romanomermis culicivorax TaxID=13658 RepID=A0A915IUG1_ROMCU
MRKRIFGPVLTWKKSSRKKTVPNEYNEINNSNELPRNFTAVISANYIFLQFSATTNFSLTPIK